MATSPSSTQSGHAGRFYETFATFLCSLKISEHDIFAVRPDEIDEPFNTLLVHSRNMTPTLEQFVGCRIKLAVLRSEHRRDVLLRQVLLLMENFRRTPLVLGNIKINLNNLPESARALVLDGVIPFGTILREEQIEHQNEPAGFFGVRLSEPLSNYFGAHSAQVTYGRYRNISAGNKATLAQVMEILSPLS